MKTSAALYLLQEYRPNLLLLHYSHLDYLQHLHGPLSPQAIATAEMQDAQIGRLIRATRELGMYDQTIFMIVSDHGHARYHTLLQPGVLLAGAGLVQVDSTGTPGDWHAMLIPSGGSCSIILRDSSDVATRRAVDSLATHLPPEIATGVEHVFRPQQIDSLGGDPNAVVMLEARPGYAFGGAFTGALSAPAKEYVSTHGYLPDKPEMLAGFIAAGPGIAAAGNIGRMHVLHIYPSIGRLMRLHLPKQDQSALSSIFARGKP